MERAQAMQKTAVGATGTAEESQLRKDAADALKGATWVCESFRERKTNAYLFAGGSLVLIAIAAGMWFVSRRKIRRSE